MLKLPNLSLKAELTKSLCGFEFQLFLSGRSASGGGEGGGGWRGTFPIRDSVEFRT